MSATTQQLDEQYSSADMIAADELDEDQIYHLLQNERRRNVLRYLYDEDGQVSMREIAEQVAAWENDSTVQAITSDERQRVYIPLYQSHLPKLDEEGIIEYDQSRGTVQKTPMVAELYEYLEPTAVPEVDDVENDDENARWGHYYLGASGIGATLLAGATLGLGPFTALPQGSVGLAILGMFWTLTLGQRLA